MRTIALLALCAGLAVAAPVQARRVTLSVERVHTGMASVQGLQLELDSDAGAGAGAGALRVVAAAVDAAGQRLGGVSAQTALRADAAGWQGLGTAGWQRVDAPLLTAALTLALDRQQLAIALSHDAVALHLILPRDGFGQQASARLVLPLGEAQAWLGAEWPTATLRSGRVEVDARYAATAAPGRSFTAQVRLQDVTFEALAGRVAVAGIGGSGEVAAGRGDGRWRITPALHLRGGEVLAGSFYARLPDADASLAAQIVAEADGAWSVESLRWDDPDTLRVELAARLQPRANPPWQQLALRHAEAHLPQAYARYAQALAAARGWGDLATRGVLRGSARWDAQGPAAWSLQLDDVDVADPRLHLQGARGALDWRRTGEAPATSLSWERLQLYRLSLGATAMNWRSSDGVLSLLAPVAAPLLGGALEVERAEWRPHADRGERLHAGLAVHGVDLAQLSAALGWPPFRGTLGGAVPAMHLEDERLVLDGGLLLQLFGGSVNVTNLALERPFGVAPSLAADIALSAIDLQPLTAAFGFGDITGHLRGRIAGLRLVDWRPVAFDAELVADEGGKISQRAVTSLSSVGGSGLAAGLQGQMLRLFDTFGYRRIRLACRLANDVCHMGGLDSAGEGYTLVEGRGLPRIAIVGHQREVDWPTLVQRLRDATSGTPPILR